MAFRSEKDQFCATVVGVAPALDQAGIGKQVDEPDNGRGLDTDGVGDDTGTDAISHPADGDDRPCDGLGQSILRGNLVTGSLVGTRYLRHRDHQFHQGTVVCRHDSLFV